MITIDDFSDEVNSDHIDIKDDRSSIEHQLLDRAVPIDYLQELTTEIAERGSAFGTKSHRSSEEILSLIVFRLGAERFAISVRSLQEVTQPGVIHAVPHRSNHLFLGLVSIRGEILLCASLHQFLGIEPASDDRARSQRMLVVAADDMAGLQRGSFEAAQSTNRKWVFSVDEVHGIYRFGLSEIKESPVVVAKASTAYTQGILDWNAEKVSYLDADRLFDTLDRRLL